MSERPVIGIAANVMHHIVDILPGTKLAYTPTDFVDGVRQAGGVPVVLPVSAETDAAQYVGMIDGLVPPVLHRQCRPRETPETGAARPGFR